MQGITTVIVAFIFVCVAYPNFVKNRGQFHAVIGLALGMILLDCIGNFGGPGKDGGHGDLQKFTYFITAILQIAAIVILLASTGGKSVSDLTSELGHSIDLVRRGGEEETIIVPLKGEQPRARNHS